LVGNWKISNKLDFSAYAGAAMFADEGLAQTYMPLFIWPLLVVSGFYINFDSIPPYFRWLSFISWLRYAFEGLEVNQFEDLTKIEGEDSMTIILKILILGCTRDSWSNYTMFNDEFCPGSNGLDLLKRRDMEDATWYLNVIYIIVIMAVARLIGLGALVLRMRWSKG
jgi:hypothetical protein